MGGEPLRLLVVDKDITFLYGERGSVKRTTDRGKTWKSIDPLPAEDVTAFACREDGRECWAGTSHGKIFAIKGDESPKRVPFPTPNEMTITSIIQSGEDAFLVSGFTLIRDDNPDAYGVLLKTMDDGATWTTLKTPQDHRFVQVASFGDTIWLVSQSSVYRSSDAGLNWSRVHNETFDN
jgi:photosystem II stability/assembly factor-like uncharacterized protein